MTVKKKSQKKMKRKLTNKKVEFKDLQFIIPSKNFKKRIKKYKHLVKELSSPKGKSSRKGRKKFQLQKKSQLQEVVDSLKFYSPNDSEDTINLVNTNFHLSASPSKKKKKSTFSVKKFLSTLSSSRKFTPEKKLNFVNSKIDELHHLQYVGSKYSFKTQNQILKLHFYCLGLNRLVYTEESIEYVKCLISIGKQYIELEKPSQSIPHLKNALILITAMLYEKKVNNFNDEEECEEEEEARGAKKNIEKKYLKILPSVLMTLGNLHFEIGLMKTTFCCLKEAERLDGVIADTVEDGTDSEEVKKIALKRRFDIYVSFANFYVGLKKYENARKYLKMAKELKKKSNGSGSGDGSEIGLNYDDFQVQSEGGSVSDEFEVVEDEDIANLYITESKISITQKKYEEGIALIQKAITIFESLSNENTSSSEKEESESEMEGEEEEEGEGVDKKKKKKKSAEKKSYEVIVSKLHLKIGCLYFILLDYELAVQNFVNCLLTWEIVFGKYDMKVMSVLKKLSFIHLEYGHVLLANEVKAMKSNDDENVLSPVVVDEGEKYKKVLESATRNYIELVNRQIVVFGSESDEVMKDGDGTGGKDNVINDVEKKKKNVEKKDNAIPLLYILEFKAKFFKNKHDQELIDVLKSALEDKEFTFYFLNILKDFCMRNARNLEVCQKSIDYCIKRIPKSFKNKDEQIITYYRELVQASRSRVEEEKNISNFLSYLKEEGLDNLNSENDVNGKNVIFILTTAWNTAVSCFKMKRNTEAEKWGSYAMRLSEFAKKFSYGVVPAKNVQDNYHHLLDSKMKEKELYNEEEEDYDVEDDGDDGDDSMDISV